MRATGWFTVCPSPPRFFLNVLRIAIMRKGSPSGRVDPIQVYPYLCGLAPDEGGTRRPRRHHATWTLIVDAPADTRMPGSRARVRAGELESTRFQKRCLREDGATRMKQQIEDLRAYSRTRPRDAAVNLRFRSIR